MYGISFFVDQIMLKRKEVKSKRDIIPLRIDVLAASPYSKSVSVHLSPLVATYCKTVA
jgi:hypothetical protein